ncbi:MAG: hypothetical protein RLZZ383_1268 [Pseudomonadota bacterium]|jgi:DNA-binding beta-propeller fold protein YncE
MTPRNLLWLALTGACSSAEYATDTGAYAPGEDDVDSDYADGSADTGGAGGGAPAETEDDRLALRPSETDRYVFVANPDEDSVTRIGVTTLSVRTVSVGRQPTAVLVTPDWQTAVVFNQGDATVTLLDAETLEAREISVRANLNHLVLSPDGRWALLWHDVAAESSNDPAPTGAASYNEISAIDLASGDHHPLVIGFSAKTLQFTPDGSLALATADASLATIDLSGDRPVPAFLPIADPLSPPVAAEVEVSRDGAFAFLRQQNVDALTVVDLVSRDVYAVPVGAGPSDLDLTPDGQHVVVVSRDAAEVARFEAADPFAIPVVTPIAGGTPLGSILLHDNGSAVLYTNATALDRYATWNLDEPEMFLQPLVKPATSMARTPDGDGLLVIHGRTDNPDGSTPTPYRNKPALSLVRLDDQRTNTLSLVDDISGYATSSDGTRGYAILDGRAYLEILDFETLIYEELALRSPAVFVGTLPDLEPEDGDQPPAWVSQQHPLGRITFYDADDASSQTLTGFALNGAIEE